MCSYIADFQSLLMVAAALWVSQVKLRDWQLIEHRYAISAA